MTYTYVLMSELDGEWYTGTAGDLRLRVKQHAEGRVRSTASRRPFRLIYYEACLERTDAYRRERFLKSGKGKRFMLDGKGTPTVERKHIISIGRTIPVS